jgi:hypothetical protein
MNDSSQEAMLLIAELLARTYLPRSHPRVRRALADADLFQTVEQRLSQVGLRWMDNIYAEHVCISLSTSSLAAALGENALDSNNNLDLPRDAQALLVVLWALIILPKRERQISRIETQTDQQNEMFASSKSMPSVHNSSQGLSYKALLEDYGNQLGKKLRIDSNLKLLERHGFIIRAHDLIKEGPLLDVLLDYDILAPRILDGALADVLKQERLAKEQEAAITTNTTTQP